MKKSTDATNKTQETLTLTSFTIDRVTQLKSGTVAADMTINGIKVYGMMVVEGKNGDFLSWPSRKGNDGKYYSICWARFSDEDQKTILASIQSMLDQK